MVFEMDESAEVASEIIKEHYENHNSGWIDRVALSTMIMALFAALSGLLAGITSNDLVVERTHEILITERLVTDQLEVEILRSKHQLLVVLGHTPDEQEIEKIHKFEEDIIELESEAQADESQVAHILLEHELFAIAVTLLSVGITLSGIALISRRRHMWHFGLVVGCIGIVLMSTGVYQMLIY